MQNSPARVQSNTTLLKIAPHGYKYSERRVQKKEIHLFFYAEPNPILFKYRERRVQKKEVYLFFLCRAESYIRGKYR